MRRVVKLNEINIHKYINIITLAKNYCIFERTTKIIVCANVYKNICIVSVSKNLISDNLHKYFNCKRSKN